MEDLSFAWEPMLVAFIMMALDMISGFAGACKNNDIRSDKMREGLWHKAGFCGIVVLAWAYEFGAQWLNFEAYQSDLGIAMPAIPAVTAVCCFIAATEVISILENLCELNPKIAKIPFISSLRPHDGNEPSMTVEVREAVNGKEGTD